MNVARMTKGIFALIVLYIIGVLVLAVTVGYVVAHFIEKFW